MKSSTQSIDKSYKTAYLSSLLLHVYAQLFIEGHEPHTLKWSYPSSMGKGLLSEYRAIWDSLKEISPIESKVTLKTYPPSDLSEIGDTSGSSFGEIESNVGWNDDSLINGENNDTGWVEQETAKSGWGDETPKKNKKSIDIATEGLILNF